jgi:hypothetical protein
MRDEQEALAQNFESFIQDFIQRDVDFQMAITTTDGRSHLAGQMVGDAGQLTDEAAAADQQQFLQDFRDLIQVGVDGSGQEMGLYTSQRFFERYQSWTRDNAYLVVVYVSDEEDQSYMDVALMVQGLQALKSQSGMVKAYSIVTTELIPGKDWETLGTRYQEVSNQTGGSVADIHQDFHTTLTDFGTQILDLIDSFPLSGVPVNADIRVTVDNVEVTSGWAYDSSNRAIRFDENTIPDEGSIVIAYYQKCEGN